MADVLALRETPEPQQPKESPRRRSRTLDNDPLQLLSPTQCASLLCCSRATIDRLIHSGRLAHIKLASGRRKNLYAIRRKALERFIMQNEETG